MEPQKSLALPLVLTVLASAAVFGSAGYYLANSKNVKEATVTPTAVSTTAQPTPKSTVTPDLTATWKTYTNQEIGFSFKYPSDWRDVVLQKTVPSKEELAAGTHKGVRYNDSQKDFQLVVYSKDHSFYASNTTLNKAQVNVNWDKNVFAAQMGINAEQVLFVKKLSNKSMLVGLYVNHECSPDMGLTVLTPLNSTYPNFEIDVVKFNDAALLKELEAPVPAGQDPCDQLAKYQQIADKINKGIYPILNTQIKTAQMIAESVTPTK